jgi:hypothetical protein
VEKYGSAGEATADSMAQRIACWIPKATNSHSEYVILIAFLLQQWLHESSSTLHYTYIVCLIYNALCLVS